MAAERCDVAVVGAGPAGAMAARSLARHGAEVALIDKAAFPRFKVCGCCLNADALRTLDRAGMAPAIAALGGWPLTRMVAAIDGKRAALALPPGLAVSRRALDHALVAEATRAGVRLLERTSAHWAGIDDRGHRLALRTRARLPAAAGGGQRAGGELAARLVLVADGLGGSFLRSAPGFTAEIERCTRMGIGTVVTDAGADYPAGTIHMACDRSGYCGVVRLEDGRLAVAAAADRALLRQCGSPAGAATRLLAEAGLPRVAGLGAASWHGTPGLSRRSIPLARPGMLVIGDAAAYVEPFTGEGMAWALASGEAVADLARPMLDGGPAPEPDRWTRAHRHLLQRRQRRCKGVSRALRHPALVRGAIRTLGRWPGLGAAVAGRVSGPPDHDRAAPDPPRAPPTISVRGMWESRMRVSILGRATARPAHTLTQREAAAMAARLSCRDERERRLVQAIFRQTGIRRRSSVLLEQDPAGEAVSSEPMRAFYPEPAPGREAGPPIRERMAAYHTHATPLAVEAAREAIDRAGIEPTEIDQVVAVSCTGLGSPGLDIGLVEALDLTPGTGRTMIGFMGCHGFINGLRVARALAIAEPGRCVLLCAVELCSLHYQYGWDSRKVVANALFNDGAAAAILRAAPTAAGGGIAVRATGCCLMPDSGGDMTWQIGNHGFEMTLSPRIPELIEARLRPWLQGWLREHGLRIDQIGSWAIHPGGPRVIDAVCSGLGLSTAAAEPSREVLSDYGNMSSPTVMFILERLRARGAPGPTVLLAFGPGLVAEAALLD